MEDILLMQFLKKKGIISDKDMHEFHELASVGTDNEPMYYASTGKSILDTEVEHISETEAKLIVSKMYHCYSGRKYVGEKYDIATAKELCSKYSSILDHSVTYPEMYIAINSQYHNYCELFKSWFSTDIDRKIIESAIVYWFKDDDYKGSKVLDYFKDK